MQQRHITATSVFTRYRLPDGFSRYRDDFGDTISVARKEKFGGQKALAHAMGVSRETISRIENGAVPRPDTLDRLLGCLGLEMAAVAETGSSEGAQKRFDGSWGGEARLDLGRDLRRGRLAKGLSLRGLSAKCGLSAAQLSRIEHGEATRSRKLAYHPDDADDEREDRRMVFIDPELLGLARLGRRLREAGSADGA